ncbi:methyl-accepting chemotaxis protein [Paenibacillus sp. NEAU-GSW1]|uniref:methyl-accepting chemotaxis protein n=1 Tax=Paenibacillus sp. NEAU-GSW1 TaxID=2682486 RepID=UPI0012E107C9|nr:methyl-accepting chemotaxis protein [Paenibacillus sp. NEAU-GSW1]MUT67752.1 HAMP domain-containing protein [Paenibacillus sp. NEAU-GSW1]
MFTNSLLARMFIFFSSLLLAGGAVLGITIYNSSSALVESSMGMQAKAVAENALSLIDLEDYSSLNANSGETEYYSKLREQLNSIREANGLKYLYTLSHSDELGYYYVVDGAPQDVAEDDFSPIGTVEDNAYPGMIKAFAEGSSQVGELSKDEYGATITAYVPIVAKDGKLLGVIGADLDATAVYELMSSNRITMIWTALAIFLISLLLIYLLARYLTHPLKKLKTQVAKVGEGDMTVAVELKRGDEVGQLADAFRKLVADTREVIQGIRDSSDKLLTAAEGVSLNARSTAAESTSISGGIQEAAQGASAQVMRSSEVAAAMEEVTISMQHIAQSTSIVANVSQQTADNAVQGSAAIDAAVARMEAIQTSSSRVAAAAYSLENYSEQIGGIVSMMADIATQTNLLALNAGIEAARAGENGRGFAVVASEVRKLATQSQQSSQQVSELIEAIVRQTAELTETMSASTRDIESGMVTVKEAGQAFAIIRQGLEKINERLHDVSAASEQLSAGSEEVSASVEDMDSISRKFAERFEQIAHSSNTQLAAMNEVSASSESIRLMSGHLNTLIGRFKV